MRRTGADEPVRFDTLSTNYINAPRQGIMNFVLFCLRINFRHAGRRAAGCSVYSGTKSTPLFLVSRDFHILDMPTKQINTRLRGHLKILAPAKINIGLRVIRKRSDRYHDIETVFYPINLSDELEIEKSSKLEFFSNINLEADANLCLRALHFFCERTGIHAEVKMNLFKRIPIGGGLGGGSSDAAAVLLSLQEIYGMPLSEIELFDIATQLGADVSFFLKKIPSYATGKGEVIEPISYRIGSYILTVTPDLSVSTALAYSIVTPTGKHEPRLDELVLDSGADYSGYRDVIINDFEGPVFEKFPTIGQIKSEMYSHGAEFSLMSGSGSSVYGFFRTEADAAKALDSLCNSFTLRAGNITPPHAS